MKKKIKSKIQKYNFFLAYVSCGSNLIKGNHDYMQVILDDFNASKGYKMLYDYILYLEGLSNHQEAMEAKRNLILLIQNLTMAGYVNLEPTLTDGGPFQDPSFYVPTPINQGMLISLSMFI